MEYDRVSPTFKGRFVHVVNVSNYASELFPLGEGRVYYIKYNTLTSKLFLIQNTVH